MKHLTRVLEKEKANTKLYKEIKKAGSVITATQVGLNNDVKALSTKQKRQLASMKFNDVKDQTMVNTALKAKEEIPFYKQHSRERTRY